MTNVCLLKKFFANFRKIFPVFLILFGFLITSRKRNPPSACLPHNGKWGALEVDKMFPTNTYAQLVFPKRKKHSQ